MNECNSVEAANTYLNDATLFKLNNINKIEDILIQKLNKEKK